MAVRINGNSVRIAHGHVDLRNISHHLPSSHRTCKSSPGIKAQCPPPQTCSCTSACMHTHAHTCAHTRILHCPLVILKSEPLVALETGPSALGAQSSFSCSRGVCSTLRAPEPGQGYKKRKTFQRLEGIPEQAAPFSPSLLCPVVLPGWEGREREGLSQRGNMDTERGHRASLRLNFLL